MRKEIIILLIGIFLIMTSFSSAVNISSSSIKKTDEIIIDEIKYDDIEYEEDTIYNHFSIDYLFDEPLLQELQIGNSFYSQILMKGLPNDGDVGSPELPVKNTLIVIPPGEEIVDIAIVAKDKTLIGNEILVIPCAEVIPISEINSATLLTPNMEIYQSYNSYPKQRFIDTGTQWFRGIRLHSLAINPVEYIPANGELSYYKEITVIIETKSSPIKNQLFRGLPNDVKKLENKIANPRVLQDYMFLCEKDTNSTENYDLLIVTSEDLFDRFIPLKQRHDTDGIKTTLYCVENIYNEYSGVDNAEKIRKHIQNEYLEHHISFVLLGGDNDTVPIRGMMYNYVPSDMYYGCLDGSYNANQDNWWGYPGDGEDIPGNYEGDVDFIADVYVGRACVDNVTEVDNFVTKTLRYLSRGANDEYLQNVLMVGEYLAPNTFGGNYMDELVNGSDHYGYETVGIPYDSYNLSRLYDHDWPGFDPEHPYTTGWPEEEIIERINNGVHIINHIGHSGDFMNMKMEIPDVDALINTQPCFIYSQGCHAGAFDDDNGYSEDCVAEHFTVKTPYGAFAGIWNSREGHADGGGTNGKHQRYHREFWDAIYGENILTISEANQDSKEEWLAQILNPSDFRMRKCAFMLNYFGDPTLILKPMIEHNLMVRTVNVSSDHVQSQTPILIDTSIFNQGLANETSVLVRLMINGSEVNSTTIPYLGSCSFRDISFEWTSPQSGVYDITVNVSVVDIIEQTYEDNEITIDIKAGVLNQNTEELFDNIQESIDDENTLDSHSILAPSGIYNENVVIYKDILLFGKNQYDTIINSLDANNSVLLINSVDLVTVSDFTIKNGINGILIESSTNCTIKNNKIIGNENGITIDSSCNNNRIYHNTISNIQNAKDYGDSNKWDNGYVVFSGGNLWSDYNGIDNYYGPNQNEPGFDLIGDTPYNNIIGGSQDRYPLMQLPNHMKPIINLDTGERFNSIEAAVYDYETIDGHTIFVESGIYNERILINKEINLVGQHRDTTVIDGNNTDISTIMIDEIPNIHITRLTIKNSEYYAIDIRYSHNITINKNTIENCVKGIHLVVTQDCNASENSIYLADSGIVLGLVENTTVWKNIISNIYEGSGVVITSNSCNNTILNNKVSKLEIGISISGNNRDNLIIKNEIIDNQNYGIYSSGGGNYNSFIENHIEKNTEGIRLYGKRNIFSQNTFRDNIVYGVYLKYYGDNLIYHNNFVNNTEHAYDEEVNNWNESYPIGGNYWDDYNGSDEFLGPGQNISGSDGIGDISYNITGGDNHDLYPYMEMDGWKQYETPSIVYVDDDFDENTTGWGHDHFANIQDGINTVLDNGIVRVFNGTYQENVIINHTIELIGENKVTTIIDGNQQGHVVNVSVDGVSIRGFNVQYGGPEIYHDAGIYVTSSDNTITDNILSNNENGIAIWHWTFNNDIFNNIFIGNKQGIYYGYTQNGSIYDNYIDGKFNGIYLESSVNNTVKNNTVISTLGDGIRLFFARFNNVSENDIISNISGNAGLNLWDSSNNTFWKNNITDFGYCGIRLGSENWNRFTKNNKILNNQITNDIGVQYGYQSHGLILEFSPKNIAIGNTFGPMAGGINMAGWYFTDYIHTIENNFANEKPIYYYKHLSNITAPSDAAQVILVNCTNFIIEDLTIENMDSAIQLGFSSQNTIRKNVIKNNHYGIDLWSSSNYNTIYGNTLENTSWNWGLGYGIALWDDSNYNKIYHNNFINNYQHAWDEGIGNEWDNSFPSGGNYWDTYDGSDTNSDGIGDSPFTINGVIDEYPFMNQDGWKDISSYHSSIVLTNENMNGLLTCPAGDGPDYQHLKVIINNFDREPIQGISSTAFELMVNPVGNTQYYGNLSCTFTPVSNYTDENGELDFLIKGDTSIIGNITIEIMVGNIKIQDIEILPCKSVDLDVDGEIDLTDFVTFAHLFNTNSWLADFNFNGYVDLSDFVLFAQHFNHHS